MRPIGYEFLESCLESSLLGNYVMHTFEHDSDKERENLWVVNFGHRQLRYLLAGEGRRSPLYVPLLLEVENGMAGCVDWAQGLIAHQLVIGMRGSKSIRTLQIPFFRYAVEGQPGRRHYAVLS